MKKLIVASMIVMMTATAGVVSSPIIATGLTELIADELIVDETQFAPINVAYVRSSFSPMQGSGRNMGGAGGGISGGAGGGISGGAGGISSGVGGGISSSEANEMFLLNEINSFCWDLIVDALIDLFNW